METDKIFIVQEYYLFEGNVVSHPSSINKNFKDAYKNMIEVFNIVPEHNIVFPSIPEKDREEFIKQTLHKFKNKSFLTIIQH
jgi:hypothetical protein